MRGRRPSQGLDGKRRLRRSAGRGPTAGRSRTARRGLLSRMLPLTVCLAAVCFAAACLASGCGATPLPGTTGGAPTETSVPPATSNPPPATGTSSAPPATGSQDSSSQGTSVTDITMPQPGSPNVPIYQALGWDNVYVLYWLQIQDGWAYIHGIPFTSTDGPTVDTRALLRQDQAGVWQVLEKSTNEGLLTDVGQVAEDQAIPERFKAAHPDAPAAIFPEVKPEDVARMDGVRTALGNPAYRFNVFLLNKGGGWAYTELRALAYEAGRITQSREDRALLRQVDGVWTVQEMESMAGTQQSDFVAGLKERYPDIPAGVLP
jgi:hypothetical protein